MESEFTESKGNQYISLQTATVPITSIDKLSLNVKKHSSVAPTA